MINSNQSKNIIAKLILTSFLLQSCSSYDPISKKAKPVNATANRRSPEDNIPIVTPNETEKTSFNPIVSKPKIQDFSETGQIYQKYKANQPITLAEFDQTKRRPHLNIDELNQVMDNTGHVENNNKYIPVHPDSNLKEVIKHNKEKAKKKHHHTSLKTAIKHKKEVTKAKKDKLATPIKTSKLNANSSSTKTATNTAKTTPVVKTTSTTNSTTPKMVANATIAKNLTAATNSNSSAVTPVTNNNNAVNVITPTIRSTAAPMLENNSITTTQKIDNNSQKATDAINKNSLDNQKISSSAATATPIDMDKLSQGDLEKLLKEKLNKDQQKGFINQYDETNPINQKPINNSVKPVVIGTPSTATTIIDSSQSTAAATKTTTNPTPPITTTSSVANTNTSSTPAVSKIITSSGQTKLGKINSALIESYFKIKNHLTSTLRNED
ncbi:MAG: hypothetical protein WBJ81_06890 [Rickettsiales bacterium]